MSAGKFIAGRLEFKSRLAWGVTAVSAFIIVLSVSILWGFKKELYSSISAVCSEVRLFSSEGTVDTSDPVWEELKKDRRISSVTPAVCQPSIIKRGGTLQGVLFHNSDAITSRLGAVIPESLARSLDVERGDTLLSYFIADKVKARNFTVEDIIPDPALLDKNTLIAYASTSDLQRVKGYAADRADCMEVRLKPHLRGRESINATSPELAWTTGYYAEPSTRSYPLIYDWIQVLDTNVLVIMTLMCIVAAFNMISAFLIMVIRSTSTIGTLKTLGMTSREISSAFVRTAAWSTVKGLALGDAAALAICLLQDRTHLIGLNPESYFVSYVPVHVNIPVILLANLAAFAVIIAFVSIPTRKIAQIDPAQSTKGETL